MRLRAGDWVEVRSKEEILGTLDETGRLEGLPFMPQMFQYCGRQFRVYKRAHKTCDTVNQSFKSRWLADGVHLELRCDGKTYGGCQAACLIFWKQAWLKPLGENRNSANASGRDQVRRKDELINEGACSEEKVWEATRVEDRQSPGEPRYVCQATELPAFTTPLPWWDIRQYVEDYVSRNVTLGRMLRGFVYAWYSLLCMERGWEILFGARMGKLGTPFRWLYDGFQAVWGGIPFPRTRGTVPLGQSTPISTLNLQPGELVRVKSYKEILATVDARNKNRGLLFDAELVPFCGGTYRVRARVSNFIDEKSGKMATLKSPAVILENVWCGSRYSGRRVFCPRSIYSWWREVWLERVPDSDCRGNTAA